MVCVCVCVVIHTTGSVGVTVSNTEANSNEVRYDEQTLEHTHRHTDTPISMTAFISR